MRVLREERRILEQTKKMGGMYIRKHPSDETRIEVGVRLKREA